MRTFYAILSLSLCAIVLSFGIALFYSYNYPMKYSENIKEYAKNYNVKGAILASIANVESNFRENAVSNKGAIGIMQLMPSTAKWIAEKMNEPYQEEKLYDGEYNLKLGSYYIAYLINYFDDEKLGICAYNAGQGNVMAWLNDSKFSDDGKTLKQIPYKETKEYYQKVSKNYKYYKNLYK